MPPRADRTAAEMARLPPPKESILFADVLPGHIQQIRRRALPLVVCSTGLNKMSHCGTDLGGGPHGIRPRQGAVVLKTRRAGATCSPPPPLQEMAAVGV